MRVEFRKIWRLALATLAFLVGLGVISVDLSVSDLDGTPAPWNDPAGENRGCVGLSAMEAVPQGSTGIMTGTSNGTLGMDGDCSGFPKDC